MSTYTVRMVIRWAPRPDQQKQYLYEERITAWNAGSAAEAIDYAEKETLDYASDESEVLDIIQSFSLFDELKMIPQGTEIFSLLRESDLEAGDYLKEVFDTGTERQER